MAHLPRSAWATIPREKLVDYLLSETHPAGQTKARAFQAAGFTVATADLLEQSLLAIAKTEEVVVQSQSPYGVKYVVDGTVTAPSGDTLWLRTIWIIETGTDYPRLVTAYPAPRVKRKGTEDE